jgi:hypothetical protein
MDRIKTARLARYLADNDINLHEAVRILQEAIRQQLLARLTKEMARPLRSARIITFTKKEA